MKETKGEWIEEQCIIIDKEITTCSSKMAYNTLNSNEDQSAQRQYYIRRWSTRISLPKVPQS
ncbi:hypothetical protein DPMN_179487 [Dreissena polymorpha]|uniref:Uncharacterized protein n=1 Tax=Dreissena polymorpha TaxID=45954 RepID=A0A9D4EF71_DREPO|nr:hypothetical protein DPMN_179487 [Dreissena polymorpha]